MNPKSTPLPQRNAAFRLEKLAITNYRVFRERTEIVFSANGAAEPLSTLHGDNGSGKSTALLALDLFFRAATSFLRNIRGAPGAALDIGWTDSSSHDDGARPLLSKLDWPFGQTSPMEVEATFAEPVLGCLLTRFRQAGNTCELSLLRRTDEYEAFRPIDAEQSVELLNHLETPGGYKKPFYILHAQRASGLRQPQQTMGRETSDLVSQLYSLKTSRSAMDRERWRRLRDLVRRFPPLRNMELSIEIPAPGSNQLNVVFEDPGRLVLGLEQLSSGEQQVVLMGMALVAAQAAVVAIEEPELSLSPQNQQLLAGLLREQVATGLVDQLLIESHAPAFDGPEVIRFQRENGATTVSRTPGRAVSPGDDELNREATTAGARRQWVTPSGYTQLPDVMVSELGLARGGQLWFFKSQERWQAWLESELTELFGAPSDSAETE